MVQKEVKISPEAHRYIIGPKGSRVEALRLSCNALIKFPGNGGGKKAAAKKGGNKGNKDGAAEGGEAEEESEGEAAEPAGGDAEAADDGIQPSSQPDIIIVVARSKDAARCVEGLKKLEWEKDHQPIRVEVEIARATHRWLSGPERKTLEELMKATSTQIHMPPSSTGFDKIAVRGQKEDCDEAIKRLQAIAAQVTSVEFTIPPGDVGNVVGSKGSVIEKIGKSTDTIIKIHNDKKKSGEGKAEGGAAKKGGKEGEKKAAAEEDSGSEAEAAVAAAESEEDEDDKDEPAAAAAAAAGEGGEANAGPSAAPAQKRAPRPKLPVKVTIRGLKASVEKAQKEILRIVADKAKRSHQVEFDVDPSMHRHIIGAQGSKVEALRTKYGVKITFPRERDANKSRVIITGEVASVNACRGRILDIVEETVERDKEHKERSARVQAAAEAAKAAAEAQLASGVVPEGVSEGVDLLDNPLARAAVLDAAAKRAAEDESRKISREAKEAKDAREAREREREAALAAPKTIDVTEMRWPKVGASPAGPSSPGGAADPNGKSAPVWPKKPAEKPAEKPEKADKKAASAKK